jgi:hypothetical protein
VRFRRREGVLRNALVIVSGLMGGIVVGGIHLRHRGRQVVRWSWRILIVLIGSLNDRLGIGMGL